MTIEVSPTSTSRDPGFNRDCVLFEDRPDQRKDTVLNIGVKGLHLRLPPVASVRHRPTGRRSVSAPYLAQRQVSTRWPFSMTPQAIRPEGIVLDLFI
jgi:hypothetical protein